MIVPGKALVGDLSEGGLPRICCMGCRGYVAWVAEDMLRGLPRICVL